MKHIALIASILAFAASADESAPRADSADSIEKTTVNATAPRTGLQSLALAKRRAWAAGAEPGLLFHCTFDDEAAITSPAVGPKGTFLQGRFMPGKIGHTVCGLDIVSNNGCGNSGFSTGTLLGNMASIRGFRQLRYDELYPSSDYRDWHHYAIVWDPDGISSLTGTPKMALLTAL